MYHHSEHTGARVSSTNAALTTSPHGEERSFCALPGIFQLSVKMQIGSTPRMGRFIVSHRRSLTRLLAAPAPACLVATDFCAAVRRPAASRQSADYMMFPLHFCPAVDEWLRLLEVRLHYPGASRLLPLHPYTLPALRVQE